MGSTIFLDNARLGNRGLVDESAQEFCSVEKSVVLTHEEAYVRKADFLKIRVNYLRREKIRINLKRTHVYKHTCIHKNIF